MPKFLTALCLLVLLSACGQSGALYLPDRGQPPVKHKDKPAEPVKGSEPDAANTEAAEPDAAPTPTEPVTDGSAAPASAPDATTPSTRSAESRVGKACIGTCRSRWSPYH